MHPPLPVLPRTSYSGLFVLTGGFILFLFFGDNDRRTRKEHERPDHGTERQAAAATRFIRFGGIDGIFARGFLLDRESILLAIDVRRSRNTQAQVGKDSVADAVEVVIRPVQACDERIVLIAESDRVLLPFLSRTVRTIYPR